MCGELKGVIDQVSSHCNTDAVGVLLLGTMVDDDPCIRDCSIRGDVLDFRVGEKKYGVSGLCYTRFALCPVPGDGSPCSLLAPRGLSSVGHS